LLLDNGSADEPRAIARESPGLPAARPHRALSLPRPLWIRALAVSTMCGRCRNASEAACPAGPRGGGWGTLRRVRIRPVRDQLSLPSRRQVDQAHRLVLSHRAFARRVPRGGEEVRAGV